jgi:hypothetical protein
LISTKGENEASAELECEIGSAKGEDRFSADLD